MKHREIREREREREREAREARAPGRVFFLREESDEKSHFFCKRQKQTTIPPTKKINVFLFFLFWRRRRARARARARKRGKNSSCGLSSDFHLSLLLVSSDFHPFLLLLLLSSCLARRLGSFDDGSDGLNYAPRDLSPGALDGSLQRRSGRRRRSERRRSSSLAAALALLPLFGIQSDLDVQRADAPLELRVAHDPRHVKGSVDLEPSSTGLLLGGSFFFLSLCGGRGSQDGAQGALDVERERARGRLSFSFVSRCSSGLVGRGAARDVRGSHGGDAEASFVDERDVGCFRGEEEEVETIFAKKVESVRRRRCFENLSRFLQTSFLTQGSLERLDHEPRYVFGPLRRRHLGLGSVGGPVWRVEKSSD